MSQCELHYLHLHELSERILEQSVTSVAATEHQLARIAAIDPTLKAFATLTADSALREAQSADREIQAGYHRGPLHGVPIAVKDLLETKNVATMAGTQVLRDNRPTRDATIIERFRSAGAVLLGKLNLTEGAMTAYNPAFDAPFNPWDLNMSPGGSSSGSGVATAAGLCFGSIGSDTGGSIRFPAAQCGVVGLKPTWGRISRAGVIDLAPSLDHVGPMTRSVVDASIIFDAIAGPDPRDRTTLPTPAPRLTEMLDGGVQGIRIGWSEHFATDGVDPETAEAARTALSVLAEAGGVVAEVDIPDLLPMIDAWSEICPAEAAAVHAATYPSRANEYGAWFRSWLSIGSALSASDYARANNLRLACNGIIAEAFANIDILVCPAMFGPDPRPSDAELFHSPCAGSRGYRQRFTVPFDYNGAPSFTIPAGLNRAGFPLSVQFVGHPGGEAMITRAAREYERRMSFDRLHPAV